MLKRKHLQVKLLSIIGILAIVVGVWWWQWQAPYRTLTTFLNALERGDIDTLHALSLPKERKLGLTKEFVERTYRQFLKPYFLDQYQIVWMKRRSLMGDGPPEIWIRQYAVPFDALVRGPDGKERWMLLGVGWSFEERAWHVAFSSFTGKVAHLISDRNDLQTYLILHRLGFRFVVGSLGSIANVQDTLEFLLQKHQRK